MNLSIFIAIMNFQFHINVYFDDDDVIFCFYESFFPLLGRNGEVIDGVWPGLPKFYDNQGLI